MVLIAISVVGMLGIPLGDPKFLPVAIGLEASFVTLTIMSMKRIKYIVIPSVSIACLVIAGNALSTTHTSTMFTLTPTYNALVLIIGGYILQGLLIVTSFLAYSKERHPLKDKIDYID